MVMEKRAKAFGDDGVTEKKLKEEGVDVLVYAIAMNCRECFFASEDE